jgi:hypothetical protein
MASASFVALARSTKCSESELEWRYFNMEVFDFFANRLSIICASSGGKWGSMCAGCAGFRPFFVATFISISPGFIIERFRDRLEVVPGCGCGSEFSASRCIALDFGVLASNAAADDFVRKADWIAPQAIL